MALVNKPFLFIEPKVAISKSQDFEIALYLFEKKCIVILLIQTKWEDVF
jgi:hypothetical protein